MPEIRQTNQVLLSGPRPQKSMPAADITFDCVFHSVLADIVQPAEYGRTAGHPAGDELFTDASGTLVGVRALLDPHTRPCRVDGFVPSKLGPLCREIRMRSVPGDVALVTSAVFCFDSVWVSRPFGSALWLTGASDLDGVLDDQVRTRPIQVASSAFVGVDERTSALRFLLLEGIDKRQQIAGTLASEDTHGRPFMDALCRIHSAFYDACERTRDVLDPLKRLERDATLQPVHRELLARYVQEVETRDA